jgi:hypothetical protein
MTQNPHSFIQGKTAAALETQGIMEMNRRVFAASHKISGDSSREKKHSSNLVTRLIPLSAAV